jgi:hypothetical protein
MVQKSWSTSSPRSCLDCSHSSKNVHLGSVDQGNDSMSSFRRRVRARSGTTRGASRGRTRTARHIPPYDRREQHLPGYNWCGPGTHVHRRMRENVQPINALDRAARSHDMVTERRGPYTGRGSPAKMRAADRRLLAAAHRCLKDGTAPRGDCLAVIAAMEYVLATGIRGRRYPRY